MRVAIIGSGQDSRITEYSSQVVDSIMAQCTSINEPVEFMLSDSKGVDASFNQLLASKGLSFATNVYAIGHARNNAFDLPTRIMSKKYDPSAEKLVVYDPYGEFEPVEISGGNEEVCKSSRDYYGYIRRKLLEKCDIAIVVWDGQEHSIKRAVMQLSAKEKFMYLDRIAAV